MSNRKERKECQRMATGTGGVTMAKRCTGGYTTTREVYKTVKKYDHQQFDEFCTRIYTNGFNDGKKSVTEKPVKTNRI